MDELKQVGEHLEELRKRIIRSVIAVGIITFFTLSFHATTLIYNGIKLYYPFPNPFDNIAAFLKFLYQYVISSELLTFLNVVDFITFVVQFLLAFGISFQLPLIMYALSTSGLIDAKFWRKNIRYAIIIIVILGAIITPDG